MDEEKTMKGGYKSNYMGRSSYYNNKYQNQIHFPDDPKNIICSFHREYVPNPGDLINYFNEFGDLADENIKVQNFGTRQIPVSIVQFTSASTATKIVKKGQKHAVPTQDGQRAPIHIRIFKNYDDFYKNITMYKTRMNKFNSGNHGNHGNHNHNHNHGNQSNHNNHRGRSNFQSNT